MSKIREHLVVWKMTLIGELDVFVAARKSLLDTVPRFRSLSAQSVVVAQKVGDLQGTRFDLGSNGVEELGLACEDPINDGVKYVEKWRADWWQGRAALSSHEGDRTRPKRSPTKHK